MFRIDNSTSVATLPITPVAGTGRFFTNGNPVSGIPATVVDDWWTNMIQEEIITVVINAGLAPNKFDRTQLWQAIQSMISGSAGGPDYDPFLPLAGGTLYAPASPDLLAIQTDGGYNCRIRYTVAGVRTWMAGVDTSGQFILLDLSLNALRFYVETGGRTVCTAGLGVAGAATANSLAISGGGITADGQIYSGTSLYTAGGITAVQSIRAQGNLFTDHTLYFNQIGTVGLWDAGNGYLYCNSNFDCVGQTRTNTLVVVNNASIASQLALGGQLVFGNGSNILGWDSGSGALIDYGNFTATGNVTAQASLVAGTDVSCSRNIFCNNPAAGGIYCTGAIVDSHGVENKGNLRFIGQSRWITWEAAGDSRPYAIALAGDRWGVYDAASNGVEMQPINRWFSVFAGGIQVDSAGQAYKAGGGMWVDSSERRFKDEIEDYSAGLDVVTRLRPRSYRLNGLAPGHIESERRHVGLIADEAADIMPEIMGEWPLGDETIATVDGTAIVYALVNSVRELSERVQNLEGRT